MVLPVWFIAFPLKQPTVLFSTEGAVYELFKCAVQYSDEIIAALREKDLTDQALSFQSVAEAL